MSKKRYLPYLLSIGIIIVDQITKALIVKYIPEGSVGARFFNDFLWIIHVRNDAVAFSMGADLPVFIKYIFFIALPIAIMILVGYGVISHKLDGEFSTFDRWALAGILGGGIGNIIDRVFRSLRVVDWISTATYGFLGMDRFPTYNIADASVVVSVILLIISMIVSDKKGKKIE